MLDYSSKQLTNDHGSWTPSTRAGCVNPGVFEYRVLSGHRTKIVTAVELLNGTASLWMMEVTNDLSSNLLRRSTLKPESKMFLLTAAAADYNGGGLRANAESWEKVSSGVTEEMIFGHFLSILVSGERWFHIQEAIMR
ncbi:unnamed protein product [Orchesella dallaii]|uniref:Uncharacterized protein n=1 Tax=Orchesella dallaii TaxID=48710 RepID=A0ABP1RNX0_9HEXA